jgi:autoinducer-2 kinase
MSERLVLVLDAGTGGGRAVAVDEKGKVRARSYRAWEFTAPEGLEMLARVFDPAEFSGTMADCCREVMAKIDPKSVIGVSTTSMREGCVFLDREGTPIYGGSNLDVRGIQYAMEVAELLGEDRAYQLTGHWPAWMFLPSRWYWFEHDEPEIIERTAHVLMINDWLIHELCGEHAGEPTNAGETMVFDLDARAWSRDLLDATGIDEALLPRVHPCGTVVGQVSPATSERTGIPAGVKVLTGMADTQAGLLAGKVMAPGEVGIVAGSTAPLMMVMDESRRDPEHKLWVGCHPERGKWLCESNSGDAGTIYRWYVQGQLGAFAEAAPFAAVEELAEAAGPGAGGARAYLGSMIWDLKSITPSARAGIFFGFPLSPQNATPGVFARAILENIAFALRGNFEQAQQVAGPAGRVALAGGMTRTRLFCRIVANVLKTPVEVVAEPEATALGTALAAFTGLGVYPDLATAAREMVGELPAMTVDPDEAEEYDSVYELWLEKYPEMMGMEE